MKVSSLILSCLLLVMAGCAAFEGVGSANTPNIDDPQTAGRNIGLGSTLIFGADRDSEPRLAGQHTEPERQSDQAQPAVPIH